MTRRDLSYAHAIREATIQAMDANPRVVVYGLDVPDHKAIYGTTEGLQDRFGSARVFGTPLSEDAMAGVGIGMALSGLHPMMVHIRMDFLLLAMNQLVNMAAKLRYMSGGQLSVPLVIRAIIGRGWGQGAQHSQGLHSLLAHIPGLMVVAPTTPADAKGCLLAAFQETCPVIVVEHRLLHTTTGIVEESPVPSRIGQAHRLVPGRDCTLVGISHMVPVCLAAARLLESVGVSVSVIDPVWLSSNELDIDTIAGDVLNTGHLVVVDHAWLSCGMSSEIIVRVLEHPLHATSPPRCRRMGFAFTPCPTAKSLEDQFYPTPVTVAQQVCSLLDVAPAFPETESGEGMFRGPF